MARPSRYPLEFRRRAVRMVAEVRGEIGHVPPVEYETHYYTELTKPQVTIIIRDLYRTRGGSLLWTGWALARLPS
ncbi:MULTISPECIES: hypothetical protein [Streptomyces]|uniref:Transposase n=1 Tax=Streptomyces pini TaxID=1520580 RepID=A0A1I4L6U6_9ACTN|nr:hypothetical protein [Streptomyces pini]SFL86724.1 hypothetical protein SAMN05192584_13018 [Streptomyces pini]